MNAMNVRAAHVVLSYSDAVSLLARHSAGLAELLHQRRPEPAERLDEHQDHAQAHRLHARTLASRSLQLRSESFSAACAFAGLTLAAVLSCSWSEI